MDGSDELVLREERDLRKERALRIQASKQVEKTYARLKTAKEEHLMATSKLSSADQAVKHREDVIRRLKCFGVPTPLKLSFHTTEEADESVVAGNEPPAVTPVKAKEDKTGEPATKKHCA